MENNYQQDQNKSQGAQPTSTPNEIYSNDNGCHHNKKSKKIIIPGVILILAAISIISLFFAISQNQQNNKQSEEIKALNQAVSNLNNSLENDTQELQIENENTTITDSNTSSNNQNEANTNTYPDNSSNISTAKYIYIDPWNIKIQIPDTLANVIYAYDSNSDSVYFWAVKPGFQYAPDFANPDKNNSGMGALLRTTKNADHRYDVVVYSDASYDYAYGHPQFVYSQDNIEKGYETEIVQLIEDMLKNNISSN